MILSVDGYTKWANSPYNTIACGATSRTDGLSNKTKFDIYYHPAHAYCYNLTTGGYNTWYLPAVEELQTAMSNNSLMVNGGAFGGSTFYYSSTEYDGSYCAIQKPDLEFASGKSVSRNVRAVRRTSAA